MSRKASKEASKEASKKTSETRQKPFKTDPQYQAAVDRLVAGARRPAARDKDALVQSWWDRYESTGHPSDFVVTGTVIPWGEFSDARLIADEAIAGNEITDAKRVRFARELILRKASGEDCYAFDAAKIRSSNGRTAWAVFLVQPDGPGDLVCLECFGVFRTLREFRQRFRKDGWLDASRIASAGDTKKWIGDKAILKRWAKAA